MSIDRPLVSFLISVHNGEPYLEEALSSILSQSYCNYEVVLVDDASTDSTYSIAQSFEHQFPSLLIHQNPDRIGLTHSLCIGTNLCSGKWIARLDADDICAPDRISNQILLASTTSNVGVVGSSFHIIDEHSVNLSTRIVPSTSPEIVRNLLSVKSFFPHSSALILASALNEIGGYNRNFKYAQDYELWLRISTKYQILSSPQPLVSIRIHPRRISKQNKGFDQIFYGRLGIISYWLNFYSIVPYSQMTPDIFSNLSDFTFNLLKTHPFYRGYFFILSLREMPMQLRLYSIFSQPSSLYLMFYYIFRAIYRREYFLKSLSRSFRL